MYRNKYKNKFKSKYKNKYGNKYENKYGNKSLQNVVVQKTGWKGRMLTGWQWIDGNCYCLDSQGHNEGALYKNTTTPDGYAVDSEGRWVVNGAVQKQ